MKKPKYLLRSELDEDMILALKNKDLKAVKLIREINSETELLLDDEEAYQIHVTLKACNKLKGEVAELGVYKGASAKLMCEATNKKVHLFDTFKGLPKPQKVDKKEGFQEFTASRKEVEKYLSKYKNWVIHE
ncbi:MAG: TylF/MycF/NovP-related O-methyltransferase [Candidatus Woesearchaeota archaeon]